MTNTEQRLRDAGISPEDVETQIHGQDKALVITARELVFLNGDDVQRGRLRDITNVKTAKTGELSVRSASESLLDGNILGFDRTELKFFFEGVKNAIARAKASVTSGSLPSTPAFAPDSNASNSLASSQSAFGSRSVTTTADDWRALTTPSADTPMSGVVLGLDTPDSPLVAPASDAHQAEMAADTRSPAPAHLSDWDEPTKTDHSAPDHSMPAHSMPVPSEATSPEEDPWISTKQTFEVEPEHSDAQTAPAHLQNQNENLPEQALADSSWNDPFDHKPVINEAVGTQDEAALGGVASTPSSQWGGDTLEASKALSMERPDMERKVSVIGTDNLAALQGVSRWLKIMAALFFLSGAAFTVTLLPKDSSNLLGYFVLLAALFGSILFSLIAWGVSELLSAYAVSLQDLRSIRRATLGH
jgi:hypothetical protein